MAAASVFMRLTKAKYSSLTSGRSRERNTITIICMVLSSWLTSLHARFDRFHVGVGEAEMVADLVHEHMGHDRAERLVVLRPVEQDWHAIEPHHVGHLHRRAFRLEWQAHALEQAEQVVLRLRLELVEH